MKNFSNILSTTVTPCLSSFGSFSLFNLFCHHWKKSTFYWSWLTFGSQGMDIMDWFCGIWAQLTKWETLTQIYKKWFGYTEVSKKPSKLKWISFCVGSWLQLDWVGALHDSGRLGLAWQPAAAQESQEGKPTQGTAMAKASNKGSSITHRVAQVKSPQKSRRGSKFAIQKATDITQQQNSGLHGDRQNVLGGLDWLSNVQNKAGV